MEERVFNGRYRIERRLGDGGMAIVYSGTDQLLRRRVAIKVLRDQFARDEDFVKRFYHEAENAARLSHPNIVNVYDVGHEDDQYYIVMELVDGATLGELIAADGKLPENVAIDYAAQIASGLAYAHRQGLLHRDIKPANILVTSDDVVKLSDFGIARAVSQHTMGMTIPGMVMGSVSYLSPEQAQGHEIDESSDLYSVGIVLYQMVLGKLPYTGDSPITIALKHVSDPVPAIEPETAGISPALASIITKLLQKDPQARYRSATDLASALREARERPTVLLGASTKNAAAIDSPTMVIPQVRVPQPPPRRSEAPDRAEQIPPPVAVDGEAPRLTPDPSRYVLLGVLLLVAIVAGFLLYGRQGGTLALSHRSPMPNFVGSSATRAEDRLIAEGITPKITMASSETVLQGRVIRQSPAAKTPLGAGAAVELVVSSGLPFVAVPNVGGGGRADAIRRLEGLHLKVNEKGVYSPNAAVGTVLRQNPVAGKHVRAGSTVIIVVSKGLQTATVPDLVSATVGQATATLAALHLKLVVAQRQPNDAIPANEILSQEPQPGASLAAGSSVSVTVSTGVANVGVPDVSGKNASDATAALQAAGLTASLQYSVQPNNATGTVMRQDPAPGTQSKHGSSVAITIPVAGSIPDVSGMTLDDAEAALRNAGYEVGNVTETQDGQDGQVARTEPAANTQLQPGESVVLYYNGIVPAGK